MKRKFVGAAVGVVFLLSACTFALALSTESPPANVDVDWNDDASLIALYRHQGYEVWSLPPKTRAKVVEACQNAGGRFVGSISYPDKGGAYLRPIFVCIGSPMPPDQPLKECAELATPTREYKPVNINRELGTFTCTSETKQTT